MIFAQAGSSPRQPASPLDTRTASATTTFASLSLQQQQQQHTGVIDLTSTAPLPSVTAACTKQQPPLTPTKPCEQFSTQQLAPPPTTPVRGTAQPKYASPSEASYASLDRSIAVAAEAAKKAAAFAVAHAGPYAVMQPPQATIQQQQSGTTPVYYYQTAPSGSPVFAIPQRAPQIAYSAMAADGSVQHYVLADPHASMVYPQFFPQTQQQQQQQQYMLQQAQLAQMSASSPGVAADTKLSARRRRQGPPSVRLHRSQSYSAAQPNTYVHHGTLIPPSAPPYMMSFAPPALTPQQEVMQMSPVTAAPMAVDRSAMRRSKSVSFVNTTQTPMPFSPGLHTMPTTAAATTPGIGTRVRKPSLSVRTHSGVSAIPVAPAMHTEPCTPVTPGTMVTNAFAGLVVDDDGNAGGDGEEWYEDELEVDNGDPTTRRREHKRARRRRREDYFIPAASQQELDDNAATEDDEDTMAATTAAAAASAVATSASTVSMIQQSSMLLPQTSSVYSSPERGPQTLYPSAQQTHAYIVAPPTLRQHADSTSSSTSASSTAPSSLATPLFAPSAALLDMCTAPGPAPVPSDLSAGASPSPIYLAPPPLFAFAEEEGGMNFAQEQEQQQHQHQHQHQQVMGAGLGGEMTLLSAEKFAEAEETQRRIMLSRNLENMGFFEYGGILEDLM
ncbi:uncharacterized protein V1518DRAFT_421993 [Limtongia smithiae]|uniref:uncharacterized protein n=1 Tax=Limtongia smithiae TaxID=1125753 RepID=UPI0034CD5DB8